MQSGGRIALGSLTGAILAGLLAPWLRGFFHPPSGGVGFVTVNGYPKSYDYAVLALLIAMSFCGGALAVRRECVDPSVPIGPKPRVPQRSVVFAAAAVFVLTFLVHDHPYLPLEPFHEGEHLTPAFLLLSGARPHADVFFLHGLAVDGGLDALVLGKDFSVPRVRRMRTFLDAATLALLAPVAAELAATGLGVGAGVLTSICAMGAGQVPVFPYFRIAPLLLGTLGLLRYARDGRALSLFLAFASGTVGVLWSLDTGMYVLIGTVIAFVILRALRLEAKPLPMSRVLAIAAAAVAALLFLLFAVRADFRRFFTDSFEIIPQSIDAIWSLPAPPGPRPAGAWRWIATESARYYLPPVLYGFLLAVGLRAFARKERTAASRLLIVAILSIAMFRTAAGRCSWSHTRYAVPLLGIAVVAFGVEPLLLARRRAAAIAIAVPLFAYFEIAPNLWNAGKFLAGWPARQTPTGLVLESLGGGRDVNTTPEDAADLTALAEFVNASARPDAPILDFSGERILYFLLKRRPAVRCPDIPMLSSPRLFEEAMEQLKRGPPACVVLQGMAGLDRLDNVPNRVRVPELAQWIDTNYPRRLRLGRFLVATAPAVTGSTP